MCKRSEEERTVRRAQGEEEEVSGREEGEDEREVLARAREREVSRKGI